MKYVEFSTGEEEFDASGVLNKEFFKDSLETQLMEKNKKLETEYTQIKVSHNELKKENTQILESVTELKKNITEKTKLIQNLEEDLLRFGQRASEVAEDTSKSPSNSDVSTTNDTPRQSIESMRENKSILPIVMSQRDRFRQKNAELEERLKSSETLLQDTRMELQSLKTDNLKLYERLKFVHVWKEGQQERNEYSVALNMGNTSGVTARQLMKSPAEDPTDKYGRLYEESMNPFTQFHRKEESRRYRALNSADKLTLNLTRVLFSHKWFRYCFVVYSLLLHLLVVVTLYQLSLWECRHDHEMLNYPTNIDDANILGN
ncbi:CASP C terminal-domain-containing protein [Sporodiniella umbellata]|nr:CASP C terminal-domain-containing protein [Sporodiniella umbellata]